MLTCIFYIFIDISNRESGDLMDSNNSRYTQSPGAVSHDSYLSVVNEMLEESYAEAMKNNKNDGMPNQEVGAEMEIGVEETTQENLYVTEDLTNIKGDINETVLAWRDKKAETSEEFIYKELNNVEKAHNVLENTRPLRNENKTEISRRIESSGELRNKNDMKSSCNSSIFKRKSNKVNTDEDTFADEEGFQGFLDGGGGLKNYKHAETKSNIDSKCNIDVEPEPSTSKAQTNSPKSSDKSKITTLNAAATEVTRGVIRNPFVQRTNKKANNEAMSKTSSRDRPVSETVSDIKQNTDKNGTPYKIKKPTDTKKFENADKKQRETIANSNPPSKAVKKVSVSHNVCMEQKKSIVKFDKLNSDIQTYKETTTKVVCAENSLEVVSGTAGKQNRNSTTKSDSVNENQVKVSKSTADCGRSFGGQKVSQSKKSSSNASNSQVVPKDSLKVCKTIPKTAQEPGKNLNVDPPKSDPQKLGMNSTNSSKTEKGNNITSLTAVKSIVDTNERDINNKKKNDNNHLVVLGKEIVKEVNNSKTENTEFQNTITENLHVTSGAVTLLTVEETAKSKIGKKASSDEKNEKLEECLEMNAGKSVNISSAQTGEAKYTNKTDVPNKISVSFRDSEPIKGQSDTNIATDQIQQKSPSTEKFKEEKTIKTCSTINPDSNHIKETDMKYVNPTEKSTLIAKLKQDIKESNSVSSNTSKKFETMTARVPIKEQNTEVLCAGDDVDINIKTILLVEDVKNEADPKQIEICSRKTRSTKLENDEESAIASTTNLDTNLISISEAERVHENLLIETKSPKADTHRPKKDGISVVTSGAISPKKIARKPRGIKKALDIPTEGFKQLDENNYSKISNNKLDFVSSNSAHRNTRKTRSSTPVLDDLAKECTECSHDILHLNTSDKMERQSTTKHILNESCKSVTAAHCNLNAAAKQLVQKNPNDTSVNPESPKCNVNESTNVENILTKYNVKTITNSEIDLGEKNKPTVCDEVKESTVTRNSKNENNKTKDTADSVYEESKFKENVISERKQEQCEGRREQKIKDVQKMRALPQATITKVNKNETSENDKIAERKSTKLPQAPMSSTEYFRKGNVTMSKKDDMNNVDSTANILDTKKGKIKQKKKDLETLDILRNANLHDSKLTVDNSSNKGIVVNTNSHEGNMSIVEVNEKAEKIKPRTLRKRAAESPFPASCKYFL